MPWSYVSLETARRRLGLTDTADDRTLRSVLEGVSRAIDNPSLGAGRTFRVYRAIRYYQATWDHVHQRRHILTDDLLRVVSFRTGHGDGFYEEVWAATDYDLLPYNAPAEMAPYWEVVEAVNGTRSLPASPRSIEITGIWGYWEELEPVGQLLAVTAEAVNITMAPGHGVETLQTLLIGSEQVYVTAVSGDTLTVQRGVNGTTAAAHPSGTAVLAYRYPADIVEATVLAVARLFRRKDAPLGIVGSADFGVTNVVRSDPDVQRLIAPYRRVVVG